MLACILFNELESFSRLFECCFHTATANRMSTLKYTVAMTCGGCERAVNSVLTKTAGVSKVSIDLPSKEVIVEGTATRAEVEAALKKTGKAFQLIE